GNPTRFLDRSRRQGEDHRNSGRGKGPDRDRTTTGNHGHDSHPDTAAPGEETRSFQGPAPWDGAEQDAYFRVWSRDQVRKTIEAQEGSQGRSHRQPARAALRRRGRG